MGLFSNKAQFLFKTGKLPDLKSYIGRDVVVKQDGTGDLSKPKKVRIDKIVGNIFKPQFYEINGTYLIGMLRFHAQMLKDDSITEDQFKAFEEMELNARKLPETDAANMAEEGRELATKIMKDVGNEKQHTH
jgi:hypothetical protein